MTLTGLPFLFVLIAVAAALVAATMLLWNRWPPWWAFPMRLLCLLLVMASGVAVTADVVNRSYGFYSSLDDLLGRGPAHVIVASGPVPDLRVAASDKGRVVHVWLSGARAGVTREALVYLPAAYFQRSQARRRFPVLELFHGYPGNPGNWVRQLHLAQVLDAEIASGGIPPLIAVIPADDDPGRDSECVDAVRGQRDETYLAVDVPADIRRDFRALDTPQRLGGGWLLDGRLLRGQHRLAPPGPVCGGGVPLRLLQRHRGWHDWRPVQGKRGGEALELAPVAGRPPARQRASLPCRQPWRPRGDASHAGHAARSL
jgi:hypothetical protein